MIKPISRALAYTAAVTAATMLSIVYVDKPLAMYCSKLNLYRVALDNDVVRLPVMIGIACLGVLWAAVLIISRKPLPRLLQTAMLAGLALLWSYSLVQFLLKPMFGRALPFMLLYRKDYGFELFRVGDGYGSFPSGHAVQATAILSVLWIQYPAWRWAYIAGFVALVIALLIGEWHFLGDIIAGAAIGAAAGTWTVRLWEILRPLRNGAS